MTTVIECVMDNGGLRPLDQDKLREFKEAHKQGEHFEMILSDHTNQALSPMARKFFSVRDKYAKAAGYSKDYAHAELKHLFGVIRPLDGIPVGREGSVVEMYGELEWQLSIRDYDTDELATLLKGADHALMEVE